jgi:hypothetical protein
VEGLMESFDDLRQLLVEIRDIQCEHLAETGG